MKKIAKIFLILALLAPALVACTDDLDPDTTATEVVEEEEVPL